MNALPEPCMCGADDCPLCVPLSDDDIERNRRDREDMLAEEWMRRDEE